MSRPVTLITAFEVPADADEPFVAGWERARELLAAGNDHRAAALHRALRPDADFRFVGVARVEPPRAWPEAASDPAFPGAELPFATHPGLYEVVREHGTPDVEGGVLRIAHFEVAGDEDERFLAGWDEAQEAVAQRRGYLGTRLHRSLGRADFRFVEIARWSSPLMVARALERPDGVRAAQASSPSAHAALYQVVRD